MTAVSAMAVGGLALVLAALAALSPMPADLFADDTGKSQNQKRGKSKKAHGGIMKSLVRVALVLASILATSACFSFVALQVFKDESVVAIHMLKLKFPERAEGAVKKRRKLHRSVDEVFIHHAESAAQLFTLGGKLEGILKPELQTESERRRCLNDWDVVVFVRHQSVRNFRCSIAIPYAGKMVRVTFFRFHCASGLGGSRGRWIAYLEG